LAPTLAVDLRSHVIVGVPNRVVGVFGPEAIFVT
jgi:hypothetical protein